ncbi:MAG: tRNA (guanosine(46)-N7)-methyltransferase TrmB [Lachnospiraceae bacterium]
MRLRNIPRAEEIIGAHSAAIKEEKEYRGKWTEVFQNKQPIHIEIGMGKGQFILNLAKRNPAINYVGIERYSSVLLRALEKYDEHEYEELTNIRFICMDAHELDQVFALNEVDKIYLNFSDPWPKARHMKRRLTSKEFFELYDKVLAEQGQVEFKTDNRVLFDFSVEQLNTSDTWKITTCTYDLHQDKKMNVGNVMTEYEEKFSNLGHPIHKLIANRK